MTTLETSLPLAVLIIGALVSIVGFVFLLHRETVNFSSPVRWSLFLLRSILCLLVWLLIAQPHAVTTRKESIPVTARMGVDVSQSMSLADEAGENTFRWRDSATADTLDEAIALAEAAGIRIHLLSRRFKLSASERDEDARATVQILTQAKQKAEAFSAGTDFVRLLNPPIGILSNAVDQLKKIDQSQPMDSLDRSASLIAQAVTGLRRVAAVRTRESPDGAEPVSRIELVNRWMKEVQPVIEQLSKDCDLQVSTFCHGIDSD